MKKERNRNRSVEMRPEYDFSGGIRGKYASRFGQGTVMVLLDSDVAKVFPDSESVNQALRDHGRILRRRGKKVGRRRSLR